MNNKYHKPLHYLLIVLLVFAPLRSVFAGQLMVCDMKTSLSEAILVVDGMVHSAVHCQDNKANVSADDPIKYQGKFQGKYQSKHQTKQMAKNCCNDDGVCKSDCHFAITASLLMQDIEYSPVLIDADVFENTSNNLIIRVLTPPSRPPLFLYS